jgi:hypothetical protein
MQYCLRAVVYGKHVEIRQTKLRRSLAKARRTGVGVASYYVSLDARFAFLFGGYLAAGILGRGRPTAVHLSHFFFFPVPRMFP